MIDDISDIETLYNNSLESEHNRLVLHQFEHDITWRYFLSLHQSLWHSRRYYEEYPRLDRRAIRGAPFSGTWRKAARHAKRRLQRILR